MCQNFRCPKAENADIPYGRPAKIVQSKLILKQLKIKIITIYDAKLLDNNNICTQIKRFDLLISID